MLDRSIHDFFLLSIYCEPVAGAGDGALSELPF
jgi:hypothetical protein